MNDDNSNDNDDSGNYNTALQWHSPLGQALAKVPRGQALASEVQALKAACCLFFGITFKCKKDNKTNNNSYNNKLIIIYV